MFMTRSRYNLAWRSLPPGRPWPSRLPRKPFRPSSHRDTLEIQKVVGQQRVNVASNISAGIYSQPPENSHPIEPETDGHFSIRFQKGTTEAANLPRTPRVDNTARESSRNRKLGSTLSPKSEQPHRRINSLQQARPRVPPHTIPPGTLPPSRRREPQFLIHIHLTCGMVHGLNFHPFRRIPRRSH